VLVRVERQALGGDAADAVEAEDLVDLAAGRLDPGDEALQLVVLAQIGGNGVERAGKVVGDREDVAGKAGRGIGAGVGDVLFEPASCSRSAADSSPPSPFSVSSSGTPVSSASTASSCWRVSSFIISAKIRPVR
jgi:hypothetical protein